MWFQATTTFWMARSSGSLTGPLLTPSSCMPKQIPTSRRLSTEYQHSSLKGWGDKDRQGLMYQNNFLATFSQFLYFSVQLTYGLKENFICLIVLLAPGHWAMEYIKPCYLLYTGTVTCLSCATIKLAMSQLKCTEETERLPWSFNSLAPGRFKVNFRWVIFNLILVVNGWGISYEIALRWMLLDLTDDKSTLVQVMAWYRQAASLILTEPVLTQIFVAI